MWAVRAASLRRGLTGGISGGASVESAMRISSCAPAVNKPSTSYSAASASASSSRQYHATRPSSAVRAPPSKDKLKQIRKQRKQQLMIKERLAELTKPDPVLGHQTNEAGHRLWQESDLCKVILTKDEVWGIREDRRGNLIEIEGSSNAKLSDQESASGPGPKRVNFGLDNEEDRKLLFAELPAVMIEDNIRIATYNTSPSSSARHLATISEEMERNEEAQLQQNALLSRILDLRNASGKGIQVENIRRITRHFGTRTRESGETFVDTGCPEVQAAILTYRIRNLHEHLLQSRHDNSNRRSMTTLIHQRAKILKYLKRKSIERYQSILPRLGLEARAVEGEIIVPGKPMLKIEA